MTGPFDFRDSTTPNPPVIPARTLPVKEEGLGMAIAIVSFLLFVVVLIAVAGLIGAVAYVKDQDNQRNAAAKGRDGQAKQVESQRRIAQDNLEEVQRQQREADERSRQQAIESQKAQQQQNTEKLEKSIKELADLQAKQMRMEEDARRLGSLTPMQRQQGIRALKMVKERMGPKNDDIDAVAQLPQFVINQAAWIDPDYIREIQRKIGEKRLNGK